MQDLATQIGKWMISHGKTIAVAESVTAGHVQSIISSVSGSSRYFVGGITTYNIDQKVRLLGVDREHAETVNCVSQKVAEQMVVGVQDLFQSDIAIATTGYAEPWHSGGIFEPMACYALAAKGHVESGQLAIPKRRRVDVQVHIAEVVLLRLIQWVNQGKK